MKSAFAAVLIAAFASAQYDEYCWNEETYMYEVCAPEPTPAEKFASLFELNEDGMW